MTFQNPLQWPTGWKRGQSRPPASAGRFKTTFDRSKQRFYRALEKLKATNLVVSSHMPLRLDGSPRADQARRSIPDNGVAIYFTLKGKQMAMARDAYETPFDNFHSLTMALEYLQGLERHGGAAMMERAFDGFAALPEPGNASHGRPWWKVLEFSADPSGHHDKVYCLIQSEAVYRQKAKVAHADNGGSHEQMIELNAAIAKARDVLS